MDIKNYIHETLYELDPEESERINGGNFWLGLLGAAVYDCIANHEAFVEGFKQGYNAK